jgi:hypothetical protein
VVKFNHKVHKGKMKVYSLDSITEPQSENCSWNLISTPDESASLFHSRDRLYVSRCVPPPHTSKYGTPNNTPGSCLYIPLLFYGPREPRKFGHPPVLFQFFRLFSAAEFAIGQSKKGKAFAFPHPLPGQKLRNDNYRKENESLKNTIFITHQRIGIG